MIASLLSGVGAASNAGLNSSLALLIVALADRITGRIDLASPFSGISSTAGILILLLVLPIELIADKLPGIDSVIDRIHTVVRPLVGGFIAMALTSDHGGAVVWIAGVLGFLAAGAVHWYKMRSRPIVTTATNGMGNPFLSISEDFAVIIGTVVCVFIPWASIPAMAVLLWIVYRQTEQMKRGQFRVESLLGTKPRV